MSNRFERLRDFLITYRNEPYIINDMITAEIGQNLKLENIEST